MWQFVDSPGQSNAAVQGYSDMGGIGLSEKHRCTGG